MAELTASDVETGAQQEPRSPSAVAETGGEQGGNAGNSFKELSQRLHRRRRSSGSHHRKPKANPKGWHRGKHRAEDLEARPNRIVNINAEQDFEFCTNFVKTSKYEPYSFLPLFLWEEFNPRTKIANVYFLFIAVLQVIPSITNTFGIPTMLLPLVFVVAVDAVFMVIEDVERHRADRRANSSPTAVWDAAAGKFCAVSWSEVHVGDILKIRNREAIPADVLLLGVAEPDPAAAAGICYVETKSLDGETNLKIRQVPKGLVGAVRRSAEAGALRGRVVMEHPNRLINNFAGTLVMAAGGRGGAAAAAPIDAEALLLRGCTLRNTRHALGLVLNTGMDTKIMMSMTAAPTKASRLSARVNREIKRMAVVMLAFCALGAALSTAWLARDSRDAWYLKGGADRYVEGQGDTAGELVGQYVIAFFYYMLLLNSFIPISLYVSMNFVRFFQAWFMNQDLDMYHEETDTPARVRTMNLNEDLGQVSHVFSDKTGTLTCNVMDFRKCSVGGKVYGRGITEIGRAALEIAGKEVPKEVLEAETLSRRVAAPHVNFYDPAIFADMHPQHDGGDGDGESAAAGAAQAQRLAAFFTALALCHTVIPEKLQDGEVVLSASSPDDEALVLGAKYFGFEFLDRADTTALIRRTVVHAPVIANDSSKTPPNDTPARTPPRSSNGASALDPGGGGSSSAPLLDLRKGAAAAGNGGSSSGEEEEGDIERYEVLHVLPFNSDRKRMSVIVRCPDGAIRLFCKGADTVMLPRLRGGAHVVAALDGIDAITPPPAVAALASPLGQATFWASPESRRGTGSTALNAASSLDGHTAALVDMAHATVAHMDAFAAEGLRTLVVASAVVPHDKYAAWAEQFDDASGDLDEINKRNAGEPNRIEDLMDVIEMGLELLGSTAIEDKLQEGVPGAIASIMAAGIKVWVLTGDKEETAINIGVACQLIWSEERMDRLVINLKGDLRTTQDIADALESRLAEAAAALDAHEADPAAAPPPRPLCLVIDGPALLELLRDQGGQRALLRFAQSCHSVVACRVTPDQKRAMVALVRRNVSGSRTLAIGDGANDVPMIQGAHIGVGISGQEGMQAVNASDYAIAQFRFLRRLMLVHGRWNYRRSSRVVCYLFYKSVLNAVPLFYYAFYNGFSGTLFYDFITTNLYAVVFTALPVLLYGIYDRDVSAAACLRYPELYVEGIADAWMSPRVFWSWMFQALAEGVWVTIVPLYLFSSGDNTQGMGPSLLEYGSVTFCLVVLVATLKMVWVQGRWAPFSVFILFLSAASWFLCTWVASVMLLLNWDFYGVFAKLMGNPSFWLAVAWCFAGVAMRDAAWKFHHRWWSPMLHHVVREYEALRRTPPDLEELLAARGARPGADKAQVKPTDELDLDRNNLTTSDSSPGPPSFASSAVAAPPPQPLRIAVEGAAAAAAAAAPQPLHGTPQTRGGGGGSRPPSAMATPRLLPEAAAAGSAPRRSSRLSSLTSDPRRTSSLLDATPLAFIPGPWSGDAADAPGLLYGADAFDPDLGGSIVTPRSSAGAAAAAAAAAGNVPGSRPLSGTFSLAGLRAPSAPVLGGGGGGGVHEAGGFAYSADPAAQQAEISMILGRAQGPFPSRTGLPHQGQHHPRRHSELQPPSHTTAVALAFASPPSAHRAATAGAAAHRPSRLTGIREAPSGDGGGSSGSGAAASSHAEAPPPSVAHLLFAPAQEAAAATPSPPTDIRAALLPPGAQQQRSTRSNSEPSAAWAAVTSGAAAAADAAAHRDRDKGTL